MIHPRLSREEIAEHVASIDAVPLAILPRGEARELLRVMAHAGEDVYCYASGGATTGTWCVWLEPLAEATRPERAGRVTVAEWCARWPEIIAQIAEDAARQQRRMRPEGGVA